MKLLSFDPSIHYSGYALWSEPKIIKEKELLLSQFGLVRSRFVKKSDWSIHARDIAIKFAVMLKEMLPERFILEFPTFHSGTKGYSAARGGSTLKLAALCGMLMITWDMYLFGRRREIITVPPYLIDPSQWKGQLPKRITLNRANRDFTLQLKEGIEENISDAIGLGQWFIEKQMKWKLNKELGKERKDY